MGGTPQYIPDGHTSTHQYTSKAPVTPPVTPRDTTPPRHPKKPSRNEAQLMAISSALSVVGKHQQTVQERLPMRLQRHSALLAATLWRLRVGQAVAPERVRELERAVKRVVYDAGCVSEALLRSLFALDDVQGDDEVRRARKAAVQRVNGLLEAADALRVRGGKLEATFLPVILRLSPLPSPAPVDAQEDTQEGTKEDTREGTKEDAQEGTQEDEEENAAEPSQPSTPPGDEGEAADLARTGERVTPRFEQHRRRDGGILLAAPLPHFARETLRLSLDATSRTLTVAGARPTVPAGRPRLVRHPYHGLVRVPGRSHQPAQWFQNTFSLPAAVLADPAAVRYSFEGGVLRVALAPALRKAQAQPPQKRPDLFHQLPFTAPQRAF